MIIRMKKIVLVTGGAGFIGSHVVEGYIKEGFKVVVVDNLSTGKLENIQGVIDTESVVFCKTDIRDKEELDKIFDKYRPEYVNHHAAQKSVPYSVENPQYDLDVNLKGFLNLLEMINKYNVKNVILVSSGGALSKEIVGNEKSFEDDVPQLLSPYAITKFSMEKYVEIYARKYGFDYSVLRYANVYGPRQDADGECGVIPIFVNNILENKKSYLMTYEDMKRGCTRDYVFVSDIVKANLMASYNPVNTVVNIASGLEQPILDIYEKIVEIFDAEKKIEIVGPREGDVRRSVLDATKANKLLKWKYKIDLEEGLLLLRDYLASRKNK